MVANAPTDIKSAENSTPVKAPTNAGGGGGGASAPKVTPIGTRVGQLRGEIDVVVSPGTGSPSSATGGAGGKPQSARSHGSSGMPVSDVASSRCVQSPCSWPPYLLACLTNWRRMPAMRR